MELGLAGKTVIVTGGASNIGRGISLAFAREGSNLFIADIDETQAKKVADQANAMEAGGRTTVVKADVTKLDEVEGVFKKVLDEFGKLDVMVNNLGWDNFMLFTETSPEFWDRVITLNYRSVLNCFKTVLPHMIERKAGCIVSIGSDAGRVGEPREAVYSGCKAGVISLTKAVAKEVGRYGVRLNVVCPGVTPPASEEDVGEFSMFKTMEKAKDFFIPEKMEKIAKTYYPLQRLGKPEDVANAVVFLASDAASFITGQTLSASGGYSMM